MGKNIGLIIFLVFVAIQVVMGIVQKVSKQQQEQKMRQMAEERRKRYRTASAGTTESAASASVPERSGRAVAPGPSATAGVPSSETNMGAQDRLDALAARRKAQLDELRLRRTQQGGRVTPEAGSQARVGGMSASRSAPGVPTPVAARTARTGSAPSSASSSASSSARASAGARSDPRAAEIAQRRQEVEESKRQHHSRDAAQERTRARAKKQREREAERAKHMTRRAPAPAAVEPDAYALRRQATGPGGRAGRLRALLKDKESLRDFFVMKEVLDLPVGMRQTETDPNEF